MAGTTIDRQTIDYSVSVTEYEAVWKNFCKEWDSCDVYKILECIVKDVIYIYFGTSFKYKTDIVKYN